METTLEDIKKDLSEKKRKKYLQRKNKKNLLKTKKYIMTKVKIPPEDRIYDRDGYWLRAACVCVKDHSENEVRFLTKQLLC